MKNVIFEMPLPAAQNLRAFMNKTEVKGTQEAMALLELAQNLELAIQKAQQSDGPPAEVVEKQEEV